MLAIYGGALRYPPLFDDAHLGSLTLGFGTPRWLAQGSFVLIGGDVVWQRLANLELHFATALLLCGFLARLFAAVQDKEGDALVLAFFGALWFLVHPVAVYGVAYLAQRSIILATLFSIAALWCVLEGLLRRAPLWHAAALAAYFLALSSKEAAVALPAVAAALAVLLRERTGPSRAFWWALAGCAALAAAVIVQRRDLLGALYEPLAPEVLARMAVDPTVLYPLSVSNQATLFFRYLGTWLVPWPGWMSVDVRTAFPRELVGWHLLGFLAWLAYGALAARLLWRGGRAGLAGFGLLFPWLLALTELAAVRIQEPFVLYRSYL
ncbi:MAG TPA: hypothetical protein VEQ87_19230, partial [Burkholderiales bacterium]|nr:hypothetical protein [Burkholderiales bacterium]